MVAELQRPRGFRTATGSTSAAASSRSSDSHRDLMRRRRLPRPSLMFATSRERPSRTGRQSIRGNSASWSRPRSGRHSRRAGRAGSDPQRPLPDFPPGGAWVRPPEAEGVAPPDSACRQGPRRRRAGDDQPDRLRACRPPGHAVLSEDVATDARFDGSRSMEVAGLCTLICAAEEPPAADRRHHPTRHAGPSARSTREDLDVLAAVAGQVSAVVETRGCSTPRSRSGNACAAGRGGRGIASSSTCRRPSPPWRDWSCPTGRPVLYRPERRRRRRPPRRRRPRRSGQARVGGRVGRHSLPDPNGSHRLSRSCRPASPGGPAPSRTRTLKEMTRDAERGAGPTARDPILRHRPVDGARTGPGDALADRDGRTDVRRVRSACRGTRPPGGAGDRQRGSTSRPSRPDGKRRKPSGPKTCSWRC